MKELEGLSAHARYLLEREIRSKVVQGPNGCWVFTGPTRYNGYGTITVRTPDRSKTVGVHRIMYALRVGPIPEGWGVHHSCDRPACCRPEHLSVGPQRKNVEEAVERGRVRKGEGSGTAKLSEEQIWQIRDALVVDKSQKELAKRFRVSASTISCIKHGKSWSWLTGTGVGKATEENCRPKVFTGKSLAEIWAEQREETEEEALVNIKEMLLEKRVIDERGCWLLRDRALGRRQNVNYRGEEYMAHRVAFRIWKGPIPEGMQVCCRCNQPSCFNPDHYWLRTVVQRSCDALLRSGGRAKLNSKERAGVRAMRRNGYELKEIAEEYKISVSQVHAICSGESWGWETTTEGAET
jgi:hypothetical protein